jgi:hypothetical protein
LAVEISDQTRWAFIECDVDEAVTVVSVVAIPAVGPTPMHTEAAARDASISEDLLHVCEALLCQWPAGELPVVDNADM